MADIIPIKANRTLGVVTSLGEYEPGDVVPVEHGGTGRTDGVVLVQVDDPKIVYATNASGDQMVIEYSGGASLIETIAQRTTEGALHALTPADSSSDASDNDLVNRAYIADIRNDRVAHTTLSNGASYSVPSDVDAAIFLGGPVATYTVNLPSDQARYRRIIVAFEGDVTALTLSPGTHSGTPNTIDFVPTSAKAGDTFTWGYDWNQYKWLVISAWTGPPGILQNSKSAAYTLVLADANKHILHPSADTTARVFTIPANSSVAYPIGTALTFVNQNAAGVITIAITTDTMRLAGAGTTGSRTLAANGLATALKITSTEWIINGAGLT